MKIRLDYHRDGLSINVPDRNLLAVAEAPAFAAPGKPEEVVEQAILSDRKSVV